MKKIDLGQTITILANIGVIGGILLLAYELRQNNNLMVAEAQFNRLSINVDQYTSRVEDAGLNELLLRAMEKEPLSPAEQARVEQFVMRALLVREWSFKVLPATEIPIERWLENTRALEEHRTVFERDKANLDPDFVRFMEENIVNER